VKRLYVTVPPALLDAPVKVAESFTVLPSVSGVVQGVAHGALLTSTVVEIVGAKKIAEAARARSWLPMPVVSIESRIMWYGEPLMLVAELPVPQSCWEAMWPPQARTTVQPAAGAVPERLNVTVMLVLHCPLPDTTFSRRAG
jgi:hypothetical protein